MYTIDPIISSFVLIILATFCLILVLKEIKQPHIIGYIIAGFILGPHVLGIIQQPNVLSRVGNIGVILLLFFVGLELSPKRLIENWIISVSGTLLQIIISILFIAVISFLFQWTWQQIILLGFIVSLSSTAVVFKLLQEWRELNTRVGQDVIGILLLQDILVVPMIIIIGFLTEQKIDWNIVLLQFIGGLLMITIIVWITIREKIDIPLLKKLGNDHETQLFLSLILCFGSATLFGIFKISAALGAFLGGLLVAAIKETHWVHDNLLPLRTIFIAFFFMSMGMFLNPLFIISNFWQVILLTIIILLTNTFINAIILKTLGECWRASIYGGSLLSQIGEFSFILTTVGYHAKILSTFTYDIVNSTIVLSLLFSPLWIILTKKMIDKTGLHLITFTVQEKK